MFIWLQGPSGAGKSTTGRILAAMRGVGFADIDELIERRAGRSIPEIFASGGEAEFRRLEHEVILSCISDSGEHRVVALGAGALGDPGTRRAIEASGLRFLLDVDPDEAVARLRNDPLRPMLAGPDTALRWRELYERRAGLYNDCDYRIDTTGRDPNDVAAELSLAENRLLEPAWSRCWRLGDSECSVSIFRSIFALMLALDDLVPAGDDCRISDANIADIYRAHLLPVGDPDRLLSIVDPGEEGKRLSSVEAIAGDLVRHGITRDGTIIGIGGGVVTDLAGFVASIYMRGIDSIAVPTTLLAQVDAAIGGKTALNAAGIRNLFGSYRQPRHVLISPAFLRTLPVRELRSGMVEALKIGIIHEPALVAAIAAIVDTISRGEIPDSMVDIIRLAVETKLRIVEQDVHDHSIRLSLNFGHTFGHAIEAVEPGRFTHGEAVAIGMIAATELAAALGRIHDDRQTWLAEQIAPLAPDVDVPHDLAAILDAMRGDKKRAGGSLRFILPGEDQGYTIESVDDPTLVTDALERAFALISHYQEQFK